MALIGKKSKSGRSMLEMLGVLMVIGLIIIAALKGLDIALNKSTANKVMEDVGDAYATMSLAKRGYEKWTLTLPAKKSRSK